LKTPVPLHRGFLCFDFIAAAKALQYPVPALSRVRAAHAGGMCRARLGQPPTGLNYWVVGRGRGLERGQRSDEILPPRQFLGLCQMGAANADFGAAFQAGDPDTAAIMAQAADAVSLDQMRAVEADKFRWV